MERLIKTGENIGVAKQIQGYRVKVRPHPKFTGLWQFDFGGETWVASDYAFVEGE